ncbi:MAG: site-specific integrase [Lachnospiraceae bacterium]|nr:site-specific integrase [Lachnospiraceae bacterium]
MIDLSYVQEQIEMKKREEILKRHSYSIWHNSRENVWYSYLPDDSKSNNRRKIKRKRKRDLEDAICDFYSSMQNEHEDMTQKDFSIESIFYEFMRHKANEVGSGTVKRMMADWTKFYEPEKDFILISVKDLTKINVDDFFNAVLEKYNLKKKAFYNMCGILKQTLEYAVDAEYIEKNPYRVKVNKKKLASNSKKPSEREVFQADEKERLLDEMERRLQNNPSNTAPLAVMLDFELGTRKGEILAICKSDIVGNRIHIHKQLVEEFDTSDLNHMKSRGFQVVDYTKSADGDRWLPLTDRAKRIIQRVEMINEEYGQRYQDFLFVKNGKCLMPDAIDAQIKRGCEHIGIPVKTMHKIRKTYASTLLHNGVNLSIVKDMLGHADESTTLKHYIYNIEDSTQTDNKVLNALDPQNDAKSDQSDQNIIPFAKKRTENPDKSTFSAL